MFFGTAMIASMAVGAFTSGLNNSVGNVEASCKARNEAKNHFETMKSKMNTYVADETNLEAKLENFNTDLTQLARLNAASTAAIKATFKEKKTYMIIGFAITIFCLILVLLFKYFKIPERLWNIIMGNK